MSPRLNHPPGRALDDLTVGDLRRLVNGGLDESTTIAAALAALAEGDRASELHAADVRAFESYRARRETRRAAALTEAASAADKGARGHGDGAAMAARQAARLETAEAFEQREPLLEFAAWIDLGRPDVHTVGVIRRAVATVAAGLAH
jgi:hypothetical protein